MMRLLLLILVSGAACAFGQSRQMNLCLRSDASYHHYGLSKATNTLGSDGSLVPVKGGSNGYSCGMEAFLPFGTAGISAMYPSWGTFGQPGGPMAGRYSGTTPFRAHAGPGLMTKQGLGAFAGWMYTSHALHFNTLSSSGLSLVTSSMYAETHGWFCSAYLPLGNMLQLGGDWRGGPLRATSGGQSGHYREYSAQLFLHLEDEPSSGFFFRAGGYSYDIQVFNGNACRIGGGMWQVGLVHVPWF